MAKRLVLSPTSVTAGAELWLLSWDLAFLPPRGGRGWTEVRDSLGDLQAAMKTKEKQERRPRKSKQRCREEDPKYAMLPVSRKTFIISSDTLFEKRMYSKHKTKNRDPEVVNMIRYFLVKEYL